HVPSITLLLTPASPRSFSTRLSSDLAATSAVGQHSFKARPGHHLSPQLLSGGSNIYERLGAGFSLLAFDGDPAAIASFETAAGKDRKSTRLNSSHVTISEAGSCLTKK